MTQDLQRQLLKAAQRLQKVQEAETSLLAYTQLCHPHPDDPDDATKSLYESTPQARMLCEMIEKLDKRKLMHPNGRPCLRVAVSIGPQMGKSQIISRNGPAWLAGRNPRANMILGSYNQDMANGFGDDTRAFVTSSAHKQVFPRFELRKGGAAKDLLVTEDGGKMAFVGVGGSGTGKPAEAFIVDDPIKNDEEANSPVYRDRVWNWFTKVVNTRIHKRSWILITHTRWAEDDLIGRLCDPDHPDRNDRFAGISDEWIYINLPAIVHEPELAKVLGLELKPPAELVTDVEDLDLVVKQFGDKPVSTLWDERFDLPFLAKQKRLDKRGFTALRMGKPTPDDGDYFTNDMLVEYHKESDLPKNLRIYGASDHAVSEKQKRDSTIIGCVGVDTEHDIWVLPDLVWAKMETTETVETLLAFFKRRRPLLWWLESELISKAFGPFLYKEMARQRIYTAIDPVTPSKEKKVRARAIQGFMGMRPRGKVHFPAFAHWWPDAKAQLLKFPYATHDDFVDWLAHIGAGLLKEFPAQKEKPSDENVVRVGSLQWILAESRRNAMTTKLKTANAGW